MLLLCNYSELLSLFEISQLFAILSPVVHDVLQICRVCNDMSVCRQPSLRTCKSAYSELTHEPGNKEAH